LQKLHCSAERLEVRARQGKTLGLVLANPSFTEKHMGWAPCVLQSFAPDPGPGFNSDSKGGAKELWLAQHAEPEVRSRLQKLCEGAVLLKLNGESMLPLTYEEAIAKLSEANTEHLLQHTPLVLEFVIFTAVDGQDGDLHPKATCCKSVQAAGVVSLACKRALRSRRGGGQRAQGSIGGSPRSLVEDESIGRIRETFAGLCLRDPMVEEMSLTKPAGLPAAPGDSDDDDDYEMNSSSSSSSDDYEMNNGMVARSVHIGELVRGLVDPLVSSIVHDGRTVRAAQDLFLLTPMSAMGEKTTLSMSELGEQEAAAEVEGLLYEWLLGPMALLFHDLLARWVISFARLLPAPHEPNIAPHAAPYARSFFPLSPSHLLPLLKGRRSSRRVHKSLSVYCGPLRSKHRREARVQRPNRRRTR
jgi:hypothetical protein